MISVIVTAYNREGTIGRCLDSILAQEYAAYEIVAVDDGSTDKTVEILHRYEEQYPDRVRCIATAHGGVAEARNAGLAASRGDFITYLDSDDYYEAGALARMAEAIGSSDVLIYDAYEVREDGTQKYLTSFRDGLSRTRAGRLDKRLAVIAKPCPWNHLISRQIYMRMEEVFPSGKYYEDFGALPLLMTCADSIVYLKEPLVGYVQSTGSIMRVSGYNSRYDDIFAVTERVVKGLGDEYHAEAEYLAWEHLLISGGKRYLACGRTDKAAECSDYMAEHFPDWARNRYVRQEPIKKRILARLLYRRRYALLKTLGK